jgi:WG containing repeat
MQLKEFTFFIELCIGNCTTMVRFILFSLLLMSLATSYAQVNAVRQAQSRMVKGRWESARQLLKKAISKDSTNVEATFTQAEWFFTKANVAYQIDSAYRYANISLHSFANLSTKQKERLQRIELDSNRLIYFREQVDSASFDRAKNLNTESSYSYFIERFTTARQLPAAIELRNEIGFLEALKVNTWKSFHSYLKTYPASHRRGEAQERYEKLLFEEKTRDRKLESYRQFVAQFPTNRHASEAEKQLFEISTALGTAESYQRFLEDTLSKNKNLARAILFHVLKEQELKLPENLLTDSLREVMRLNHGYWIPMMQKGKFGFLDSLGIEAIDARYDSIDDSYLCGAIRSDVLKTSQGLIARNGKKILPARTKSVDLGGGFLKVGDEPCSKVIHKSGRTIIATCMQGYQLIGNSFLIGKENDLWGLYALNGRQLLSPSWQSIQVIENVIVLTRLEKKTLCTPMQLARIANGNSLPENFVFDEVRSAGPGFLLVRNGGLEGILNSELEFKVPLDRQSLTLTPYGLLKKLNDIFMISGLSKKLDSIGWSRVLFHKQWLLLSSGNRQNLFDLSRKKMIAENADSIWFDQGLAFVKERDSIQIHINSKTSVSFSKDFKIAFVKSKDSVLYFYTEIKNRKTVFDITSGAKLFTAEFDQIESITSTVFLITKKNKMGLLSRHGKVILPTEYDVIVKGKTEFVSLYWNKKFGLFDLKRNKLIKPLYDKNLIVLNANSVAASKGQFYGLIGWNGKPLTTFEFDEIRPWMGNVVWARKNSMWQLYDFRTKKILIDKVEVYRLTETANGERVALVQRDNLFGIVSSVKGIIIPATFSTVVNVGSEEHPLYFTDKEVEEAGVHVVIYYDKDGKFLRKQVYEEDDFERIFCGDSN